MTFYELGNERHSVEILRRFSADVLKDETHQKYTPYTDTEVIEPDLKELFFLHWGVTGIALYYGCPEPVIVEKILSMDLYSRYDDVVQQLQEKHNPIGEEKYNGLYEPQNPRGRAVRALRRATPEYSRRPFDWTAERIRLVYWLFKMGEDITDIALRLWCPEWMVLQVIMENRMYDDLAEMPWFQYSDQACRDRFLDEYHG